MTELGENMVYSITQPNSHMKRRNESKDIMELRIPTFASVHAWEKSGTNAGLSSLNRRRCLGKLAGYTSEIGGSEEGEWKGMKIYGVVGMTDGPGCVSGSLLVAVVVSRSDVDALKEEAGKSKGDTLPTE